MAGAGGSMMAGVLTEGRADSGYGVMMAGFHTEVRLLGGKLAEWKEKFGAVDDVVSFEDSGYVTFLFYRREPFDLADEGRFRVETFRREPHRFFADLPGFLRRVQARSIRRFILTGSLGSISLTILFTASGLGGE